MNDKKKMIVLGSLVTVLLAVGVFQFGGKPAPAPAPAPKPDQAKAAPAADPAATEAQPEAAKPGEEAPAEGAQGLYAANPLPARDPFNGGDLTKPTLPPGAFRPDPAAVAPKPTMPAPAPMSGGLPAANGLAPMQIASGAPLPSVDDFTYTLSGVIVGSESAAVFTDSTGNQRLIVLGGSIEPDSKLVKVGHGKATVRHHGKTITLTVGETAK